MLEALERGEYRSTRAAGIAAGIVKVPTALERAKTAIKKLSAAELVDLLAWLEGRRTAAGSPDEAAS